jgi:2-dehydropantoate 2-reductase
MVNEGTYRTIQQEGPARERMKLAMQEVIMVAQKSGVQLTQDDFNAYIKLVDSLSASGMPSMRQDGLAKRKSEVELFSGALIKKAQLCNVEVPINQALYQEIIKIESNY